MSDRMNTNNTYEQLSEHPSEPLSEPSYEHLYEHLSNTLRSKGRSSRACNMKSTNATRNTSAWLKSVCLLVCMSSLSPSLLAQNVMWSKFSIDAWFRGSAQRTRKRHDHLGSNVERPLAAHRSRCAWLFHEGFLPEEDWSAQWFIIVHPRHFNH